MKRGLVVVLQGKSDIRHIPLAAQAIAILKHRIWLAV
jgi:hypothetical protein